MKAQDFKVILVVDDDPDYSDLIRLRLETAGFKIVCVPNGNEALKILKGEFSPDLIILDVDMPEKNGLATLINMEVQLKKAGKPGKRAPVIVATGMPSAKIKEIMMSQNVDDFLQKPFEGDELLEKVGRLLEGGEKGN